MTVPEVRASLLCLFVYAGTNCDGEVEKVNRRCSSKLASVVLGEFRCQHVVCGTRKEPDMCLLLLFSYLIPTADATEFEIGNQFADAGNYAEAVKHYNTAIKILPHNALIFDKRGEAFFQQGLYAQALADHTTAIQLDHSLAKAYFNRAEAYSKLGEFERAIADFTVHLKLRPRDADSLINRGRLYFKVNRLEQAVNDLREATRVDPNRVIALQLLSRVHARLGDSRRALEAINAALEIEPRDARLLYERGTIYVDLDDVESATRDFSCAQEIDPRSPLAYIGRARMYFLMDDPRRSFDEASQALEIDPNCAEALGFRGAAQLWLKPNEFEVPLKDFDRAIRLKKNSPWAYLYRATIWHLRGMPQRAVQDLRAAEEHLPRTAPSCRKLAVMYQLLGEVETAIELQREAVRLAPVAVRQAYRDQLKELERGTVYPVREGGAK